MLENVGPEGDDRSPASIVESVSQSQTQSSPPSSSPSSPVRLTEAQRAMVNYLRDHFCVHGAAGLVRRYGLRVWKEVLSDYEALPDSDKVRNPAGLLIWLANDIAGGDDDG